MQTGSSCRLRRAALVLGASLLAARPAGADVKLRLAVDDSGQTGFLDETPYETSTLGTARLQAVRAAADYWQDSLSALWTTALGADSPTLELEVQIRFAPAESFNCDAANSDAANSNAANSNAANSPETASNAVAARSSTNFEDYAGRRFPQALAHALRLARGESSAEDAPQPAITLEFNNGLGTTSCPATAEWDLHTPPLDLQADIPGAGPSLYGVALHELAHGLGITTLGQQDASANDVFLSRLIWASNAALVQSTLLDLPDDERQDAIISPRSIAWTGAHVRRLAFEKYHHPLPQVHVSVAPPNPSSPELPLGLDASERISPLYLDATSETLRVTAPLKQLPAQELCAGAGMDDGSIVLVDSSFCTPEDKLQLADKAGAQGLIIEAETEFPTPVLTTTIDSVIPGVLVAPSLFQELTHYADAGADGILSVGGDRVLGLDAAGRPYLFTPQQLNAGTSLTHWDPILWQTDAPPLMLPRVVTASAPAEPELALAVLADLGWAHPLCGDGTTDSGEECDAGQLNSDTNPDTCRFDCTLPRCGDAALDSDEDCDNGLLNSKAPHACRTDCTAPRCGDGVTDWLLGEQCDDGTENSDLAANACRTDCQLAYCGDAVMDDGEACDDGASSAPGALSAGERPQPNTCRPGCMLPRCGDGIVDTDYGEQCDDGNTIAGPRCTADCRDPRAWADAGATKLESPRDAGRTNDARFEANVEVADARAADADATNTTAEKSDGRGAMDSTKTAGCDCRVPGGSRVRAGGLVDSIPGRGPHWYWVTALLLVMLGVGRRRMRQ